MEVRRKVSFLLAVLAVVVCYTRGSFYTQEPRDAFYSTSSCPSKWCGEKWSADRILYYNYTIDYVERNVTQEVTTRVYRCPPGVQESLRCVQSEPITEVVNQIVRTEIKNRTLEEIVELPQELSLGFIVTDNINTSGHYLNESYQLNQDKIWQIRIPRQCRMIIYFREFDLETTEGCVKDYFTIQTSKAQKNIRKYCTSSLRRVEIRNRRRVQMWFHSDETVAKRGIYGSFCFSKWPASADDTPCNCNLVPSKRRQRSLENDATTKAYSPRQDEQLSREHTAAEDVQVGEWLMSMMRNGQKVEEYLHHSSDPKQRLLAQKYQEALNAYSIF